MADQRNKGEPKESSLKVQDLSFWQGVSIIAGVCIGSGILSLAYGSRHAGFPVLVFWIIVAGIFTTISMLYVAEATLRTNNPFQLSGLAVKYLGNFGAWIMFVALAVDALSALTAYTIGSGDVLKALLGVPEIVGSLMFFVPAIIVVWLGLKATGVAENVIVAAMALMILVLVLATFLGPGVKAEHLTFHDFRFSIPVFHLVIFSYIAQYTVPQLSRGFARGDIRRLPRAIITGMVLVAIMLIIVPMSALGLSGPENIAEVATISWAQALGTWAFVIANLFTLCAFMTSFWVYGESMLTNIVERFRFPSEWDIKYRFISILCVALPPIIIAYTDIIGFVDVLSIAGGVAGCILGVLPVLILNRARKYGDRKPIWSCGWIAHPIVQSLVVLLFSGAFLYKILEIFNILPKGW